jgi:predicted site-specific integrase-resolvase
MKSTYSPKQFGSLIDRTTKTLQKWDRDGILNAHRSITNRRYYTHDQYLKVIGRKAADKKLVTYCRVSSAGQKNDLISQRLIVSSNSWNKIKSGLVIIIPLTSVYKDISTHVRIDPPEGGLNTASFALCEQITSISKERLKKRSD